MLQNFDLKETVRIVQQLTIYLFLRRTKCHAKLHSFNFRRGLHSCKLLEAVRYVGDFSVNTRDITESRIQLFVRLEQASFSLFLVESQHKLNSEILLSTLWACIASSLQMKV